jgi:hypothetical protein
VLEKRLNISRENYVRLIHKNNNCYIRSTKGAYRNAKCKKPHFTGESSVLPAATDTVEMLSESHVKELQQISPAGNIMGTIILDISEGLCD